MVTFNDADDFMSTMAEGGKAFRFEDIDGIGPATADKITSVRGVNAPTDVKGMSADELADKAGISENRARKAISGAGGNPNVSKTQSSSGSVSAAGIRSRQGDFWVEFSDMDKARARNDPRSRSEEAVRTDERKRAPITTDLEQWKQAPGEWDYPGVDTPTQDPKVLPKDFKAGGRFDTAEFDDSGSADFDDANKPEFPKKEPGASGKENFNLRTSENRKLPASLFTAQGGETPDVDDFGVFTEARDISLSPDEAFSGVGATSSRELGGNFMTEGERSPTALDEPPQQAIAQQSQEGSGKTVSLPAWTLSRGQTYLNEKVFGDGREDLRPVREKVRQAEPNQPVRFEPGEYERFKETVKEGAKEEIDRADRMEANIFGDTDKQAEVAEKALQGLMGNPPKF
jgi:hypothetical protein